MDNTDLKEMFLDAVGGTSLEDDTVSQFLTDSLMLLDQLTAHQGVDFREESPLLIIQAMQYYYDLAQRNNAAAKENLAAIMGLITQHNHDFVQVEQEDYPNYMGDRP